MISQKQHEDERLFRAIIEQLKLPLLHIARKTESVNHADIGVYNDINSIAEISIKLIDSYLLTMGHNSQLSMQLEPVSISSVLNDVANNLASLAKLYNCSVELDMAGKYGPVMSQRSKLEAAFTMLGYSYIEASHSNNLHNSPGRIILRGYRSTKGLVAGIFSPQIEVNNESFSRAINNKVLTKQSIPDVSQSTGAGIFLADSIFNDLATKLRVTHYKRISGLASTLIFSQQLQLIR